MIPVQQTDTELGRGNCLAACVASILELPIAEVPNFRLADDAWGALQDWLASRGLLAIRCLIDGVYLASMPSVYCVLTGPSPRNPVNHAVVGLCDCGTVRIVHDPHPEDTGLAGPAQWITFFGKTTP